MADRSFCAHHFHGTPYLNVSGDASFTDGVLSLTRSRTGTSFVDSVGRAVYPEEIQLWDPVTRKAADFFTHFSFNISMLQPPNGGDGIAFFMAPNGSTIPDFSWGECLALIKNCSNFNASGIVAVEFDTYQNDWDPSDNHIGININSIRSAANITFNTSIKNGSKAHAWISYDSRTTNLSVFLTYLKNPIFSGNSSLSYKVNLSKVLPEWVTVGFSSATGYRTEIHNIASWEFNSTKLHKNLVQLIGWCHEKGEFLLIYEFMPNGSLDSHLFGGQNQLSWAIRYKIALGLASALLYLHEEWEQTVIHRDIKSSNVMLDSNFNARLGDFGLARLMDQELGIKITRPAGTFGYMAPEYVSKGKASKASDIYSFGVVVLEIACGRRSIESKTKEAETSLLDWVWRSYENERLVNVADEKLHMDFDLEQMERLMIVGLWCAHPDCNFRPSIRQALHVLNFEAPLPNLPKKMPVPKYDIPATSSSSSSCEPLMSDSVLTVGR
ncbi:Protein kinase domain - like 10 [Theobroma cacao]|nr:Protein kinase domain - like 10 [Theobroma cacao]